MKTRLSPCHSSNDDNAILVTPGGRCQNPQDVYSDTSSSDTEYESDSSLGSSHQSDTDVTNNPRRSSRQRQSPNRYGNPVNYDSSTSLPGENEVTQSWWPGYPRGSYSLDQEP